MPEIHDRLRKDGILIFREDIVSACLHRYPSDAVKLMEELGADKNRHFQFCGVPVMANEINNDIRYTSSPARLSPSVQQVVDGITEMIKSQEITPSKRLPSERALAERVCASRNTVREGLHYLETLGIIETRRGSGSYIKENPDTLFNIFESRKNLVQYNTLEMIETRRVLETGIVRLTAQRATRSDKIELQQICDESISLCSNITNITEMEKYIQADYRLHRQFAVITRNSILLEMFESVRSTFLESLEIWQIEPTNVYLANELHKRIVSAIISGNSDDAEKQLKLHLDKMMTWAESSNS